MAISKTTVAGVLSAIATTGATASAALAPYQLTAPSGVAARIGYVVMGLTVITAIARVWVGYLTPDADQTPAIPRGGGEPQLVPAHPVPDDPAAKVVIPDQK
jgi:hypothetical protein